MTKTGFLGMICMWLMTCGMSCVPMGCSTSTTLGSIDHRTTAIDPTLWEFSLSTGQVTFGGRIDLAQTVIRYTNDAFLVVRAVVGNVTALIEETFSFLKPKPEGGTVATVPTEDDAPTP